ncbi:M16 family metallopeptidase [Bdellovibrio sp. HCB337]|uniref:M16 family metallopeptidase n=1 Tax=Bdellovibrio sp. HCB337 TaxID=3394358 RepID=UPI0039A48A31
MLSEQHPNSRAVSIGIWVLTGTRDESADEGGISHLLEHMVFKGTKTRSAYQIAKSLEALGGDLNAYTTREYTCYHALVLKDHWEKALDVLCDLVSNMEITANDFRLEKGVILQEIAMTDDTPEELIYDVLFEKAYAGNPVSTPILGTVKSVASMSQKKVMDYYKSRYTGKNIIVTAAGSLDHKIFVSKVEEKLAKKKKAKFSAKREKPRWKKARAVLEKSSEQTHMLVGLPTASFRDDQRFESYIVNTLLGGGMTSKLYQSVREKKGLVYSIHSMLNTFVDSGAMMIYAGTDVKSVRKVSDIISKELRKLKKTGASASDVELFKTQVIGSILLGSDDIENRMTSIAVNEMVFGEYRSVDSVIQQIQKVTRASVNEFVRNEFDTDKISGVLMGAGVDDLNSWWKDFEF